MSNGHERELATVRYPQAIAQHRPDHRSAAAFRRRGPDCPRRKPPPCWTLTAHGSAASAQLQEAGPRADRRTGRGEEGGIGDVICEDCGETNKPGTEFCMFCGAYLGWQEQEPAGANDVTQLLPGPAASPRPRPPTRDAAGVGQSSRPPRRRRTWLSPNDPRPAPAARRTPRTGPHRRPASPPRSPSWPPRRRHRRPPAAPTCGRRDRSGADASAGTAASSSCWPGTSAPVTRPRPSGHLVDPAVGQQGPGRPAGVPTQSPAAVPLATGDHRGAGPRSDRRRSRRRRTLTEVVRAGPLLRRTQDPRPRHRE